MRIAPKTGPAAILSPWGRGGRPTVRIGGVGDEIVYSSPGAQYRIFAAALYLSRHVRPKLALVLGEPPRSHILRHALEFWFSE